MASRQVLIVLAAVAALSGGCAHGSGSSTHGRTAARAPAATRDTLDLVRLTRYTGHGITFTYPAAWRYRNHGFYSNMSSPVVDVASQPTRSPCAHHTCWFPVRHLRPGGVVVMWETGGLPRSPSPAVGVHVRVLPNGCLALGGREELEAQVVLRGGRVYDAGACLRGPNIAASALEVRAMFASARRAAS